MAGDGGGQREEIDITILGITWPMNILCVLRSFRSFHLLSLHPTRV